MDIERPSESADEVDRDIAFRAFDTANVGAMDAGSIGERLLRKTNPLPQLSQVMRDELFAVDRGAWGLWVRRSVLASRVASHVARYWR